MVVKVIASERSESMKFAPLVFLGLCVLLAISISTNCQAQVRAKFTADGFATCQQPSISNFPLHIEGEGTLSKFGSGDLNVSGNVTGYARYQAKLGARPTEAPGGSASLRAMGRSTLRATRDYPNNYTLIDLQVRGASCTIKISNFLKPGKRQYTFVGGSGRVAYCSRPIFTRTSCSPI